VPGRTAFPRSRVTQRFPLQSLVRQAGTPTVGEEVFAVRGYEMGHGPPEPDVPVQPQPAVHRVDHAVAAAGEFPGDGVSGGVVGHRPRIAPRLLAEELTFDRRRRQWRNAADEHRALDGIGQWMRDLGGPAGGVHRAPRDGDAGAE
jgi:hypothetical protein